MFRIVVATVRQDRSKMMVTSIREAKYICIWKSGIDWQLSVMSVIRDTRMQARCDSRADFRAACLVSIPRFNDRSFSRLQFIDETVLYRHYHTSDFSLASPLHEAKKSWKRKEYIKSTREPIFYTRKFISIDTSLSILHI